MTEIQAREILVSLILPMAVILSRITKAQQKLLWTRIKFGFTSDFRSLCGDLSWIDLNSVSPLSL